MNPELLRLQNRQSKMNIYLKEPKKNRLKIRRKYYEIYKKKYEKNKRSNGQSNE